MWVEITPTREFIEMPHNITFLYASVNGSMVGLSGKYDLMIRTFLTAHTLMMFRGQSWGNLDYK